MSIIFPGQIGLAWPLKWSLGLNRSLQPSGVLLGVPETFIALRPLRWSKAASFPVRYIRNVTQWGPQMYRSDATSPKRGIGLNKFVALSPLGSRMQDAAGF